MLLLSLPLDRKYTQTVRKVIFKQWSRIINKKWQNVQSTLALPKNIKAVTLGHFTEIVAIAYPLIIHIQYLKNELTRYILSIVQMFHPHGKFRLIWDFIIMLALLYTAIEIPVNFKGILIKSLCVVLVTVCS